MAIEAISELFEDVLKAEDIAYDIYVKLIDMVGHEEDKNVLQELISDEARHAENAREILRILDEEE